MIGSGMAHLKFFALLRERLRLRLCMGWIAACLMCAAMAAQERPARDSPAPVNQAEPLATPTLHLATNLVQIPVLILTAKGERLPAPIATQRFQVKLQGGPAFEPKYARVEGDDPIDLSIVVDTRIMPDDLLRKLDDSVAGLAPEFLHAGDHVSIFVIDCSTVRAVKEVPAERARLKRAVDLALVNWTERQTQKKGTPCDVDTHLWDVLAYVTDDLSKHPGWHAVVAVTDGTNKKGKFNADTLARMAQDDQVTILGLDPALNKGVYIRGRSGDSTEDFGEVCGLSGGLWLGLYDKTVAERMQWFTQVLRDRYIVEFPRPPNLKPGSTAMTIKIAGMEAFIRPAGDLVPVTE